MWVKFQPRPKALHECHVISACDLDVIILCLCETYKQIIEVCGYTWFGNNCKSISKQALQGSGVVGILIKESVLNHYNVASISDKHEGILWQTFIDKTTNKQFGIRVRYLPPVGSSRSDQFQEFLPL